MHNILIVDDEPTIRQSLKGVLEDEGFKTSMAESGEAGLEIISKQHILALDEIDLPIRRETFQRFARQCF